MDPIQIFDHLDKWGFPILFVVGQLMGWWYMKPHVDMMAERVRDATLQVERSQKNEERAITIAQQSHELVKQTLESAKHIEAELRAMRLENHRKD